MRLIHALTLCFRPVFDKSSILIKSDNSFERIQIKSERVPAEFLLNLMVCLIIDFVIITDYNEHNNSEKDV